MDAVFDIFQGALLCALVILIIEYIKNRLLFPIRAGKNMKISAVIKISGSAPELESVVRALDGVTEKKKIRIFIVDCGMDDETKKISNLIAKKDDMRLIVEKEEFLQVMAEK